MQQSSPGGAVDGKAKALIRLWEMPDVASRTPSRRIHAAHRLPVRVMHLIQLLLPLRDQGGEPFPRALYAALRDDLVERFGGLTVYTRAPASGLWQESDGQAVHDDIVIYEVMTDTLDPAWWGGRRAELELQFAQQSLVVRAHSLQLL
jgi:hypothetical protein